MLVLERVGSAGILAGESPCPSEEYAGKGAGAPSLETARVLMTADNAFELWVNGRQAGAGANFTQLEAFGIRPLLRAGTNIFSVRAVNREGEPTPAGLLGAVTIRWRDGRQVQLVTARSWEVAREIRGNWLDEAVADFRPALELRSRDTGPWSLSEQTTCHCNRHRLPRERNATVANQFFRRSSATVTWKTSSFRRATKTWTDHLRTSISPRRELTYWTSTVKLSRRNHSAFA